MSLRLDLGCGPYRREGHLGLDLKLEKNLDIIGDAHNLPIRDNVLEEIISTKVFEHLNNPYQCFSECKRVIKKWGRITVSIPNIHNLRRFLRWAVKGKISVTRNHIYCWGLPEIIHLGNRQGLVYKLHYFDTYIRYYRLGFLERLIRRFNKRITDKNLNVVFSVA